ncbi:hydantoinase/oxoprolinase N-terminal domain-containing protein [Nesterenkonia muleiensis]|uniref:hydantoinase/oxoprolinase N-terminal domain-containing protein n=1 Tax=Nesterenkonia muleiensis TaxID=2282648 RepID=UPI000E7208F1|nr:hydantoinase/oxoprolinase family protein [Nesterenkonia muleiensis]
MTAHFQNEFEQGGYSVGIDVGGTNTDAVVLDVDNTILTSTKEATTEDVTSGIRAALESVLDSLGDQRSRVSRVMLGTTHATNAIVDRRNLGRVAVLRLGAPASTGFPPLMGWPEDLRKAILAGSAVLPGGFMADGMPISPLDQDSIRRFLDSIKGPIDAVAICGIFSPSFPEQEREVEEIVLDHLGLSVPVSRSHDIGAIGLLERENATVINAALYGVAKSVTQGLMTVVDEQGLENSSVYFAQNDGTLMAVNYAARFPVLTIGSGPANSIRGAALLSGVTDAIVVDVGGTTSDLGVVTGGFPRESTLPREIGGVRTNFRMPDIISIGVGGGTRIDPSTGDIGSGSVGHHLHTEALIFGGSTPTLTDAAVACGVKTNILSRKERQKISSHLSSGTGQAMQCALINAHERIQDAVDRLSHGKANLPLVIVGGGGFLVPEGLTGVEGIVYPKHGGVANAVGAALSLVGGRAQQVSNFEERKVAIDAASRAAIDKAIEAGADPLLVEVVDVSESPMSYSTQQNIRISVKVAGPLARLDSPILPIGT